MASLTRLRHFLRNWQLLIVLAAAALWAVITAGASAWWTVSRYHAEMNEKAQDRADNERQLALKRADNEKQMALAHRVEAQQPFLQKKLEVYFSAIKAARSLTDPNLRPDSQAWKDNTARFWELRWGELEMVGDAGIRKAAHRVGEKINEVEYNANHDRHDLRWSVECLADELRLSLEHAWGLVQDPAAMRRTATGEFLPKNAGGCTADPNESDLLPGMQALVVPANLHHIRNITSGQ